MDVLNFEQKLHDGKVGESIIACWLRKRGFHVLPIYDKEMGEYKGPAVYLADGEEVIAPDILAFDGSKIIWIEAKHKHGFSWYRKTQKWVTGIDLKYYHEYIRISELVDWPIWIMFLHKGGQAKDSPESPSGLYGGELKNLLHRESHRSDKMGSEGMVFWAIDMLNKLE